MRVRVHQLPRRVSASKVFLINRARVLRAPRRKPNRPAGED